VRVCITRRPKDEVDGIRLHRLRTGVTYDLNASLATYLVVAGYAHAVADQGGSDVIPADLTRQIGAAVSRLTEETVSARRARKRR
jgi:hypothetical protein